jgi:hypothetical protein
MNPIKIMASLFKYGWVLPVSCIGVTLLPFVLLSGGGVSFVTGAIEAQGGLLPALLSSRRFRFSISALTVGHVIFSPDSDSLRRCRDHEHVHIRQYERWGPFFPPLYLLSSAAALLCGRDPYWNNSFEQEAFRLSDPWDASQG